MGVVNIDELHKDSPIETIGKKRCIKQKLSLYLLGLQS